MSCESMQTGHTTMTTLFIFHTWRWNAWIQDFTNSLKKKKVYWDCCWCQKWPLTHCDGFLVVFLSNFEGWKTTWISLYHQLTCHKYVCMSDPLCWFTVKLAAAISYGLILTTSVLQDWFFFLLLNINGELHHFKVSYQPLRTGAEDLRRPWRTADFHRETLAVWKHCHSAPVGLARHLELNHWLCSCSHRPRSPPYTHH